VWGADIVMIGFAGLSHLGIVSSIAIASKGFEVMAHDPDFDLCQSLRDKRLPLFEPELENLLEKSQPRIDFSEDVNDLAGCNPIFISADVPTDEYNRSDLSAIRGLTEKVAKASKGSILVVLSQVTPGFTRAIATAMQQRGLDGSRLFYQVETLIFGRAVERALSPERYIVGCSDPKQPLPQAYSQLLSSFKCPILPMRYESAELAKLSINLFLSASLGVTNSLAELASAIGADWSEIEPTLKLDKRIGPHAYLKPGLGIGGGNLERDLVTIKHLAGEHGTNARVINSLIQDSRYRSEWVLRVLYAELLSKKPRASIGLWGLAYKAGTRSIKNSPALALIASLNSVPIKAYDPQVQLTWPNLAQTKSALEACRQADALVIMAPWTEFTTVELSAVRQHLRGRLIVDPFGTLNPRRCQEEGLIHRKLGSSLTFGSKNIDSEVSVPDYT